MKNIEGQHYDSQPMCNQEFFTKLDEDLKNMPKQMYIEKLTSLTNDCDDTIFVYRAILAKRARLLDNFPQGQLMTRKRTKAGTVAQKYAADCYCLNAFILNKDPKIIADTFCRKSGHARSECVTSAEQSQTFIGTAWFKTEFAELKSELNMLKEDVHTLKVQKKRDDQIIMRLESELIEQKQANDVIIAYLKAEIQRIQTASVPATTVSRDSDIQTDASPVSTCRKQYTEVVTGGEPSTALPVSSQTRGVGAIGDREGPPSKDVPCADITTRLVFNRERQKFERKAIHETQKPNKIEVRITSGRADSNRVIQDRPSSDHNVSGENSGNLSNAPVFQSVKPKHTRRYYIGGISSSSNRAGFIEFLSDLGVKPVGLRLIHTKTDDLAAKLTVDSRDSRVVEDKTIWPRGVYCRRWYSENEWSSRVNNKQTRRNKSHYD